MKIKRIALSFIIGLIITLSITIPVFALGTVASLRGIPSATSISLHWTKATASTGTRILYKTTGYPANENDGTVAFGGGTFTNGTGTAAGSPITLHPQGNTVTVTGLGTFTIALPTGSTGTATSGVCTILNSPVSLVGGSNTINTLGIAGTITVTLDSSNDSFSVGGLSAGTPYYFAAWGWDGANYSASSNTLLINTSILSSVQAGDNIPTWVTPASWNQTPVAANLDNLAPLTNIMSDFWTSWQVPTNNGFLLGWCILTTLLSIFAYVKTREVLVGFIVAEFILAVGVFSLGIPSWLLIIPLCFAGGVWAVERYLQ